MSGRELSRRVFTDPRQLNRAVDCLVSILPPRAALRLTIITTPFQCTNARVSIFFRRFASTARPTVTVHPKMPTVTYVSC